MDTVDLGPATRAVATLVEGVADEQLQQPTPCPDYDVADLVDHLRGLALAFTGAARKDAAASGGGPDVDGSRLGARWREETATALLGLGEAWREPGAHDGVTMAGPVELPADVAALVALNEVVVHGWDLAVATRQDYRPDPTAVEACHHFVASFEAPADDDDGLFGPPVDVPGDAPAMDRLVAAAGRRPDWSA